MFNRTLADLQAPDERTQYFTPFGLGITHTLTPEDAVAYQHELLAGTDLAENVSEGVRRSFDDVRVLFLQGVLQYECFTHAGKLALLTIEQALRDRFLTYYGRRIVLVNSKSGQERVVQASSFDQVQEVLRRTGRRWQLQLTATKSQMAFDGGLANLWTWARREGLLPGQRARALQWVQRQLRNGVAHPSGYRLDTPVDAALVLRDVAEIINCLWGHRTPGGRLHPAPVRRSVFLMVWDTTGMVEIGDPATVPSRHMAPDCTGMLVRAVTEGRDEMLMPWFDPQFETTRYPVDVLWGPGRTDEARRWFDSNGPDGDEVDHLDRYFMIRRHNDGIDLPRRTAVASGLPVHERTGTWFLVIADDPISALNYIRDGHIDTGRTHPGTTDTYAAATVACGDWTTVLQHAARLGQEARILVQSI